jgi:hypothetical protein
MKKYTISTESHNGTSLVGGYTNYETIAELIGAYLDKKIIEGLKIKNVGLSLEYINSLNYLEREKICERDGLELLDALEVNGINEFEFKFGRLFFKRVKK